MRQDKDSQDDFRGLGAEKKPDAGSPASSRRDKMEQKDHHESKDENLDRIRAVIVKEKEAAQARFRPAEFRSQLVSRLGAQAGETPQPAPGISVDASDARRRSARASFRARPLAAVSLAAGIMAVLAALWFFVVSPALRSATLERHIYEVLLQSAPRERLATETGAGIQGPRVFPAAVSVPEHEIPIVLYKILENLSTIRPASIILPAEEEHASPTEDRLNFEELLKRIKEV